MSPVNPDTGNRIRMVTQDAEAGTDVYKVLRETVAKSGCVGLA